MSERKVLNKYYPPDFDPSKIPRAKLPKNRQYTVRLMAPFNMRCSTCGEYIYKGKKFNARKEDVEGQSYLGIRIYRFYIKCTRCLQEISFKTDPQNTDYEIEAGATRNFMALKLAEEQAKREEDEEKEEEATNPMKLLEKRTQQSKQELELLESLEELKDLNRRQQTIDYDQMLQKYDTTAARLRTEKEQEELDELEVQEIFKKKRKLVGKVVEEETIEIEESEDIELVPKVKRITAPPTKTSSTSLANKKKGFGIVIKPSSKSISSSTSNVIIKTQSSSTNESNNMNNQSSNNVQNESNNKASDKPNSLSLLGSYSGSEEDSN
ncbi:splicing factor YJU2 [Phymastichus coffea]|uniref:splicing factor YJU2 n=1 Tax=Phymastichus coffea TaxID=108790 RepID=UPI00273BBF74|nr:splicing factor YJU2 [Phymastichus coffea]